MAPHNAGAAKIGTITKWPGYAESGGTNELWSAKTMVPGGPAIGRVSTAEHERAVLRLGPEWVRKRMGHLRDHIDGSRLPSSFPLGDHWMKEMKEMTSPSPLPPSPLTKLAHVLDIWDICTGAEYPYSWA